MPYSKISFWNFFKYVYMFLTLILVIDCNDFFFFLDFQFIHNPLMKTPLFLLVAKTVLVESEESLTVCQVQN